MPVDSPTALTYLLQRDACTKHHATTWQNHRGCGIEIHVPHALHVKLTSMDLRGKFKSMDTLFSLSVASSLSPIYNTLLEYEDSRHMESHVQIWSNLNKHERTIGTHDTKQTTPGRRATQVLWAWRRTTTLQVTHPRCASPNLCYYSARRWSRWHPPGRRRSLSRHQPMCPVLHIASRLSSHAPTRLEWNSRDTERMHDLLDEISRKKQDTMNLIWDRHRNQESIENIENSASVHHELYS